MTYKPVPPVTPEEQLLREILTQLKLAVAHLELVSDSPLEPTDIEN